MAPGLARRAHAVRRHGGGAARQPSREPSGPSFTGSSFTGSSFTGSSFTGSSFTGSSFARSPSAMRPAAVGRKPHRSWKAVRCGS
ncbi:pentapeptide repeat-containing protein [Streptomyces tanashiensis]|uniref:pentapeptide repeat-containing protein n=1 Tax=Streptomyces tanashiensis TaxID=67367 RepID=UPI0033E1C3CD